jgi:hypothetical protein
MSCPTGYHQIPFGYLILHDAADVRAGSAERRHEPFDTLAPVHLLDETRIVEDVVGSKKVLYPPDVPPTENLLQPLAY